MTHHSVITSSLRIKILKIGKFDFSCDMDYKSRTDVFRDFISVIIDQSDSRRPKGASGGYKVSDSRAVQASEARLLIYKLNRSLRLVFPMRNLFFIKNVPELLFYHF